MDNRKLNEFLRVSKGALRAQKLLGKTVEVINEDALNDAEKILQQNDRVITMGVKNTSQIDRGYIKRLIGSGEYVWHTIDAMAEGGRAVDERLINPLTLKPMTGSSSATAVNVLYGVNDIGIGTDGGGSVLAPALSLNLFSIMAKGMGLKGSTGRVSTDGINFIPGIGVISHEFEYCRESIFKMLDIEEKTIDLSGFRVCIPKKGNIVLPDGRDMREKLNAVIERLMELNIKIGEEDLPDFQDRESSIEKMKDIFNNYDVAITFEGPVDLVGMGDSVFGNLGSLAKSIQNSSGKYMVKIANMINGTSITLPWDEAASGIVITGREGIMEGTLAIGLAEKLKGLSKLPELYCNYFKEACKRRQNNIIFSLKEV